MRRIAIGGQPLWLHLLPYGTDVQCFHTLPMRRASRIAYPGLTESQLK